MNISYKIFFSIWIVYLFFISTYGGSYLAESIIHESMAIVDKRTFVVNDYMKEGCKQTGCDYSYYNGNFYSGFAPGTTFLIVPFYIIFKPIFNFIPNLLNIPQAQLNTVIISIISIVFLFSILSVLISVLIYNFLEDIIKSSKKRLLIVFTFAFGTLFFTYSVGFYPRILSAFFLFCSFFLLYQYKKDNRNVLLFISGLFGGYAVTIDFPQIISLFLLFLYLLTLKRDRKIILFIVGIMIPLSFLMLYNITVYDSIIPSSYQYRVHEITPSYSTNPNGITYGIPKFETIFMYLFSLKYGLFVYMPILFLSFYGVYLGFRKKEFRNESILFLLIFLLQLIFYSSFSGRSPCTFGLRYLLPIIPFIIIPLSFTFEKISLKIVIFLSSISILINFVGVMYDFGCTLEDLSYYFNSIKERGLTSYTLTLISTKINNMDWQITTIITLISFVIILLIIYFIWKK